MAKRLSHMAEAATYAPAPTRRQRARATRPRACPQRSAPRHDIVREDANLSRCPETGMNLPADLAEFKRMRRFCAPTQRNARTQQDLNGVPVPRRRSVCETL